MIIVAEHQAVKVARVFVVVYCDKYQRVVGNVDIVFVKCLGVKECVAGIFLCRCRGGQCVEQGEGRVGVQIHKCLGAVECRGRGVSGASGKEQQCK